jgi:hypothetical protein
LITPYEELPSLFVTAATAVEEVETAETVVVVPELAAAAEDVVT